MKGGVLMLKIAICDDSQEFIAQIASLIQQWSSHASATIINSFENGNDLIRAHSSDPFHIIFLDVVMPGINGIETARFIRETDSNVKIVFLTASRAYAFDSYSVKANNYLLKPIQQTALNQCLDELSAELDQKKNHLVLRTSSAIHRVELENIEYLEAQNKHVLFMLTDGRVLESIDPLYTYEPKLPLSEGFFKCHRSYIVNLMQIAAYTQKEITMRSGCRIPISRNCHKDFKSAYFSVLFQEAGEDC